MTHLALVGPPHLTGPRVQGAQRIHRIGRGAPAGPVIVGFDPADQRSCRDLLAWFERGGQRGATLLIDDWKLCAESDPGLAETVRWIAATAPVQVIITARSLADLPGRVRRLVRTEVLDFLSLHGIREFTKTEAWVSTRFEVSIDADISVDLGRSEHSCLVGPRDQRVEGFRSLMLGLMATHSPRYFRAVLVEAHDADTFAGLDQAPHVHSHFRGVAESASEVVEMLRAEHARRLKLIGGWDRISSYRNDFGTPPQLFVCVSGTDDLMRDPEFAHALSEISKNVEKSGMQLILDAPHDLATNHIDVTRCTVPSDFAALADSLPHLMRRTEPTPGFLALHGMPDGFDKQNAWRPVGWSYRVPFGVDEHGQALEVCVQPPFMGGSGNSGEVVAPDDRRTEGVRAIVLGEMTKNSPSYFQALFVDFHGTGVFEGLDRAPHAYGSFSGLAHDPDLAERVRQGLESELELRKEVLQKSNWRTVYDYRKARRNGAQLDPLPNLLLCVDGLGDLVEACPEFKETLHRFVFMAKSWGTHLLMSGSTATGTSAWTYPGFGLELGDHGWTWRLHEHREPVSLPADLDGALRTLIPVMWEDEPEEWN